MTPEGLGWGLDQDKQNCRNCWGLRLFRVRERGTSRIREAKLPTRSTRKFLRVREKANQGPSGEATQALKQEISVAWGGRPLRVRTKMLFKITKEAGQSAWERKSLGVGEVKSLQSPGGRGPISPAWEVAQGEAPAQPRTKNCEEFRGTSAGLWEDGCRSLGCPRPRGRSTKLMQNKTNGQRLESAVAVESQGRPGGGAGSPSAPGLAAARALSSQERPTALPGYSGLVHNRNGLQDSVGGVPVQQNHQWERRGAQATSKAAWPGPQGRLGRAH